MSKSKTVYVHPSRGNDLKGKPFLVLEEKAREYVLVSPESFQRQTDKFTMYKAHCYKDAAYTKPCEVKR